MLHRTLILAVVCLVGLILPSVTEAGAQRPADVDEHRTVGDGPNAAAVVVDTGEEVKTVCVRFAEEQITGDELLDRADLDAVWSHFGTLGASACSICGVGCPADNCHCAMPDWWSYWQTGDNGWTVSPIGASTRTIRDGDIDAWVWHDGSRRPPEIAFATVCTEVADSDAAPPPGRPEADPQAAEPPVDDPTLTADQVRGFGWFALTLLAVLGVVVWIRRQRGSSSPPGAE